MTKPPKPNHKTEPRALTTEARKLGTSPVVPRSSAASCSSLPSDADQSWKEQAAKGGSGAVLDGSWVVWGKASNKHHFVFCILGTCFRSKFQMRTLSTEHMLNTKQEPRVLQVLQATPLVRNSTAPCYKAIGMDDARYLHTQRQTLTTSCQSKALDYVAMGQKISPFKPRFCSFFILPIGFLGYPFLTHSRLDLPANNKIQTRHDQIVSAKLPSTCVTMNICRYHNARSPYLRPY